MSSFGAGGGSISGSTGGGVDPKHLMQGLGLDSIMRSIGQNFQQGGQGAPAVQPGQMASMSPQQRLAAVMRNYSGGQG